MKTSPDTDLSVAKAKDVYRCTEVLKMQEPDQGINNLDFGLIRLDRPVTGRTPIKVVSTEAKVGDKVFMMGYPNGLPFKMASDSSSVIRDIPVDASHNKTYTTNLDAFESNSGSAVFRQDDLALVGILVRGDRDLEDSLGSGSCQNAIRRDDSAGIGERVIPAFHLIPCLATGIKP